LPAGFNFTATDQGFNDAIDSDANANGQTACFTLNTGQSKNDVDAGATPPRSSIGNFVWQDNDGDGVQDPNEPGIPNITVSLYSCNGTFITSTFTDASGFYSFANVLAGSYYVIFSNQAAGFTFTAKDQGGNDPFDSDADASGQTACFTVNAGQNKDDVDAGLIRPASIGDFVWEDLNGNGIQDRNEPGISGVVINLFDCSNNLIATTTTNAAGFYQFQNLVPGSYFMSFVLPAGNFTFTQANVGGDDTKDSDPDASGVVRCFTLNAGENKTDIDAGILTPGGVGNFVWDDLNKNGIQDSNEPGVRGVTVRLYSCGSTTPVASTSTNANGNYFFSNVSPGSYYIEFSNIPAGFIFTQQDAGTDDAVDSDADASGKTNCFTINAGQNRTDIDAGLENARICLAVAGTVTPTHPVFDLTGSSVTVTATDNGNSTVPAGYSVAYLFANQAGRVLQISNTPSFVVTQAGDYCIHVLVYDGRVNSANYFDTNNIVLGTTFLWQINNILSSQGICGEANPGCTSVRVVC
jgi:hypothetical protein